MQYKEFKNPQGYWEYQGAYTVVLAKGTPTDRVPDSARIEGNIVHVSYGRIGQCMGGIQFYSKEQAFSWGYDHIKEIQDAQGNPIWRNNRYTKM